MSIPDEFKDQARALAKAAKACIAQARALEPTVAAAVAAGRTAFEVAERILAEAVGKPVDPRVMVDGDRTQVDCSEGCDPPAVLLLTPTKIQVQLPSETAVVFERTGTGASVGGGGGGGGNGPLAEHGWQFVGGDARALRTADGDLVFLLGGGKDQVVLCAGTSAEEDKPEATWADISSSGDAGGKGAMVAFLPGETVQVQASIGPFEVIVILPDGTVLAQEAKSMAKATARSAAAGSKATGPAAGGTGKGGRAALPSPAASSSTSSSSPAATGIPTPEECRLALTRFAALRATCQAHLASARGTIAAAGAKIATAQACRTAAEVAADQVMKKMAASAAAVAVNSEQPVSGLVALEDGAKVNCS